MLEQIFTKEFLTKTRRSLTIVLSLVKYAFLVLSFPGFLLCASGVDAPDPYGNNAFIGCVVCIAMLGSSMLIEMFVVRFLIKDNEHIKCIFEFDWYGLKSYDNWKKYKKELRDEKFKRMMCMINNFDNKTDANVFQLNEYKNSVRYKEARRM